MEDLTTLGHVPTRPLGLGLGQGNSGLPSPLTESSTCPAPAGICLVALGWILAIDLKEEGGGPWGDVGHSSPHHHRALKEGDREVTP